MLMPEQVIPFLQHDDPIVRGHAVRYFNDTSDFGPLTADHYWAVIDRLGENDQTLNFVAHLRRLPQTDASLQRLVRALTGDASDLFDFHCQHLARDMELGVLARNPQSLLNCPHLLPHVRQHLEMRLNLLTQSPLEAWDRLMEHGRELCGKYAFSFNPNLSDALIEAAARGGNPICERAMELLDDKEAGEDWREIFAVRVLGLARYEPAIDDLVSLLRHDTDVLRDQVTRALSHIGSLSVIDRIVSFYPGRPWHVRLYTRGVLADIKRPQSEYGLLKLLGVEMALEAGMAYDGYEDREDDEDSDDNGEYGDDAYDDAYDDDDDEVDGEEEVPNEPLLDQVLIDLTQLGSLAALNESRDEIEDLPDDPEILHLCECLLATAIMNGVALPEEFVWRHRLKERDDAFAARQSSMPNSLFSDVRQQWRETGISCPPSQPSRSGDEPQVTTIADVLPDEEVVQPIHNTTPKVGRNQPCPCGSGKKYKKCCGQ